MPARPQPDKRAASSRALLVGACERVIRTLDNRGSITGLILDEALAARVSNRCATTDSDREPIGAGQTIVCDGVSIPGRRDVSFHTVLESCVMSRQTPTRSGGWRLHRARVAALDRRTCRQPGRTPR